MSESFAYGAGVVVTTDGSDVLVYEPSDESPKWKARLPAVAIEIDAGDEEVVALDGKGRLARFDAKTGDERGSESFEGTPRALAVSSRGAIAVALAKSVIVIDGESWTTHELEGARALAWDAARLAIGLDNGKLLVFDGETAGAMGEVGDPVRGVTRHPSGAWLATAGDRVVSVADNGEVDTFLRVKDTTPSRIACSLDGSLVVVKLARNRAQVVAHPSKDIVLTAVYPDREVTGAALADDGRFVWIGLDNGDANKIDLDSGDVYRTDPHAGRDKKRWVVRATVDKAARAKQKAAAKAKAASPKKSEAAKADPSSALRKKEEADQAPPKPTGPREVELPPSPAMQRNLVLVIFAVAAAVALASLKCG